MAKRNYSSTSDARSLALAMTATDTGGSPNQYNTITLNTITGSSNLPSTYPFTLVVDPDISGKEEIITVLDQISTYVYSVSRGSDGSSAVAHSVGAAVKHMVTARDMQEPQEHIEASAAYSIKNDGSNPAVTSTTITKPLHGLNAGDGNVVGTLKTQTLTNKTLTSPTINSAILGGTTTNSGTISGGTVTSTISGSISNAILSGTTTATSGTIAFGTNASAIVASSKTISATELSYLDGVTSAIQTQLDSKAPIASPTFTGTVTIPSGANITSPNITRPNITGTGTNIANANIINSSISSSGLYDNVTLGSFPTTTAGDLANAMQPWLVWIPTFSWTLNGLTNNSKYTRIGKTIYFNLNVVSTGTIVPSGNFTFTLPDQPIQGGSSSGSFFITSFNYPITATYNTINTTATVYVPTATSTTANTALTALPLTSVINPLGTSTISINRAINISGFYEVA